MKNHLALIRRLAWVMPIFTLQCESPPRHQDPSNSHVQNVFGSDEREVMYPASFPFSAIGRLDSGCTGTLVAPQWVLTAAHCIVDGKTGRLKPTVSYFRPAYAHNSPAKIWIDSIWLGTYNAEEQRLRDFAFLKLTAPAYGFGTLAITAGWVEGALPIKVALAGFSTDKDQGEALSLHRTCSILSKDDQGRLLHDCDSTAGVSGGPLIWFNSSVNQYEIAAIAVSEFRSGAHVSVYRDSYSPQYANAAIASSQFKAVSDQILYAPNNDPSVSLPGVFYLKNTNTQSPAAPPRPEVPPTRPPSSSMVCPPTGFAIDAAVLTQETQSMEDQACGLAVIAPRFVEWATGGPHAPLYDAGSALHTSSVYLCSIINNFKRGLMDYVAASHQLAPHLCLILSSTSEIDRYVQGHYNDLAGTNGSVSQVLGETMQKSQSLGRLILRTP